MTEERVVRLLIARHPETEANVARRFIGTGESPYTDAGREQADRLASCIAAWDPGAVRCSPRLRAREVASTAAVTLGIPLHVDDDLAEIDFGAAEGLTYDEARGAGVPMDFLGGPTKTTRPFEGGETWTSFAERVDRAIAAMLGSEETVAVVTHGGVFRAIVVRLMGLEDTASWRFAIPPATIATLSHHEGKGTLETFGLVPGCCPWEKPEAAR